MSTSTTHDRRAERRLAMLLLAPTVLGVAVFTVIPIVGSFALAFFRWNIIDPPEFVGLDNFSEVGRDPTVVTSFANTIVLMVGAVGLQLAIALLLATLLQAKMPHWLRLTFRSTFFFPLVLSAASVSVVMKYLFNEQFGVVNWVLGLIGVSPVSWLTSPFWAPITVILVYVWQQFGFTFLLFVGGLNNIPKEMYEAASLDGASGWKQMRAVTLPLLSPVLLVASVVAIINALQIFEQPFVMTAGGPGDATRTAVMVMYESGFERLDFGQASAIGAILFALILGVTALQFRLSRRFVFYQ
jgi:multiple sugar transport system permease protein